MYTIKQGRRAIGLNMAQNPFMANWANIFIDCPTCDQSIGLKFGSSEEMDKFTDAEFLKVVRDNGWAVLPNRHIACPACR